MLALAFLLTYFSNMKNSLTIILLILTRLSFAQSSVPTQFDTFISRPSIQWAAYVFDSLRFQKHNLASILVHRMTDNQIITSLPLNAGAKEVDCIEYCLSDDVKDRFGVGLVGPAYDSLGNIIAIDSADLPKSGIDSLSENLLFCNQVLYVEDERLQAYIPWISPTYSMYFSYRRFAWFMPYFSTSFNFDPNYFPPQKDKILKLESRRLKVKLDSIAKENMLKELYGKNLVWALWPSVESGAVKIYSVKTGQRILPEKINQFIVAPVARCYDRYNDVGEIIGCNCENGNPIPFYITEVDIIQDWIYDYTANKVICKIPEMLLYVGRDDDGNLCVSDQPELKIIF